MKHVCLLLKNSIFIYLLFLLPISSQAFEYMQVDADLTKEWTLNKTKFKSDTCLLGDCVSGIGVLIDNKNQKLVGQFSNGKLEGYGIIHYTSGSIFIGQFKNGLRNGQGSLKHSNKLVQGIWANDRYIKVNSKKIEGCKSGNCNNGHGIYIYNSTTVFMGKFSGGRANGMGICFFSDGDIYYGKWRNHRFKGYGTYLYSQSLTIQTGYWNDGYFTKNEIIKPVNEEVKVSKVEENKSEIFAVVVGVAQYRHMKPLKYTDDDAYAMTTFLRSPEGGAVKKSNIKILIDEAATKKNILSALTMFANKADNNDVFIFYFSGHGMPESLLPIDYDGEGSAMQLYHKDLVDIFKSSNAKSKVVIADACYSGSMLAFKGEEYESSMNNYYNEIRKNEGGLVMIMSSKAEETSIENNGLRQGIFSHFLMRGLYGAANTDNDNLIRLDELFEYVQKNVAFYTNSYQTPMIYGDKSIDLPIAVIRE